jgi:hypothetical protein
MPFTRPVVAVLLYPVLVMQASAQALPSEHGVSAQTVNGTTITVEYYRPVARGRELFGKLVRYGHDWTPGANWATTIDVDHDIRIEGQPLPKGKYSVWMNLQPDEWTVALHRTAKVFHTFPPGPEDEQLRFKVKPQQGPHTEMLTWSFPSIARESAELHFQWGTTDVPLHIGIIPVGRMATLKDDERAAYVGTYQMTHLDPRSRVKTSTLTVFDSAGVLRVRRSDPPDKLYDAQYDLFRVAEHTFQPLMYRNGAFVGLEPAMTVIFTFDDKRATGVEVLGPGGGAMARGTLKGPY